MKQAPSAPSPGPAGTPGGAERPPRLVVFDLDGTLVDSSADIHEALDVALRAVPAGRNPAADDAALAAGAHGLPLEVFFRRARPQAPDSALAAFIAAYREHYYAHLLDRTRPFPGVVDGLARLRAHAGVESIRTAVATTKMTTTARRVTDGLGLSRYFDVVLGSDNLPCKPDPAVLLAVFSHFGATYRPSTGLMVGDTEMDIHAGRAAGLRTCAVAWSELPLDRLHAAQPDYHVADFAEVVDLIVRM